MTNYSQNLITTNPKHNSKYEVMGNEQKFRFKKEFKGNEQRFLKMLQFGP